MTEKTSPSATTVPFNQDGEEMTPAESREALIMALKNLLQALDTLRQSLLSLQTGLVKMQEVLPLTPAPVKATGAPPLDLLKKPRILH